MSGNPERPLPFEEIIKGLESQLLYLLRFEAYKRDPDEVLEVISEMILQTPEGKGRATVEGLINVFTTLVLEDLEYRKQAEALEEVNVESQRSEIYELAKLAPKKLRDWMRKSDPLTIKDGEQSSSHGKAIMALARIGIFNRGNTLERDSLFIQAVLESHSIEELKASFDLRGITGFQDRSYEIVKNALKFGLQELEKNYSNSSEITS